MNRDAALGVGLLLVAAGYYALASALPPSDLADAVGPAGLPKAYAVVLAVLSVLQIVRASTRPTADAPALTRRVLLRVAGLLAIGVLYIAVVPWVGYPVAIAGLIVGTSYYQGGRLDARVWGVGVLGALALWVVFVLVLGIEHPQGVWLERLMGEP